MNLCRTCAAWFTGHFPDRQRALLGQCRRHAPSPVLEAHIPYMGTTEAIRPRWPVTLAAEGCLEHIPAVVAPLPAAQTSMPCRTALPLVSVEDVIS